MRKVTHSLCLYIFVICGPFSRPDLIRRVFFTFTIIGLYEEICAVNAAAGGGPSSTVDPDSDECPLETRFDDKFMDEGSDDNDDNEDEDEEDEFDDGRINRRKNGQYKL